MPSITLSDGALLSHKAFCYGVFCEQDFAFSKDLKQLADASFPDLKALMDSRKFTGKLQQTLLLPFTKEGTPAYLLFVGLGGKTGKAIAVENYRRAIGRMIRSAEDLKASSLVLQMPSPKLFGVTAEYLAEQTGTMINVASYHFDEYITDQDRKITPMECIVATDGLAKKDLVAGFEKADIVGKAVNQARHWIDLPPMALTPIELSTKAKKIAKDNGLKITVFDEKEVNQMGMGGLAAVSRGSDNDCQLVIMEYIAKKGAPTLALVGKGITFDSGGLSIKPAVHMETMKEDMSGAAAVISAMQAIAQLKPKINVIGITPLSENLVNGKATKPGDICRFYNGKTAEIKNTDAEGRLVLADALSYAVKHYKPDAIVDIATLTGSCAYALGPFFSGLMSEHDALVDQLQEAAHRTGDRVWRLPLSDDYKPAIKSIVADICNIGSPKYMAGAITAALFLQNFVEDTPWAHLDIAGVAFDVPDLPYFRAHSATGYGVRLMVDLAMNFKAK